MVLGKIVVCSGQSLKFSTGFSNFGEHLLLFIQVTVLKQYFLFFCNKDYRSFFFVCLFFPALNGVWDLFTNQGLNTGPRQ